MRCKAAWWYSAALAAAGSLHLILYVRYVHTRIVRGVRRKLFVMYAVESTFVTVKQFCEKHHCFLEPDCWTKYVESFDVFGTRLSAVHVGAFIGESLILEICALPCDELEQYKKVMQDAPVLHDFVDGYPLVVTSGYWPDDYEETYNIEEMELLELPVVLILHNFFEDEGKEVLDRLVMYQKDKARFRDSVEFQEQADAYMYMKKGEKYREEICRRAEAEIEAAKERQAAEEERIAQAILNFRQEIEQMEAMRLQWSLNAPSEMEAAAAEAEAELDEQFARRLDFINEANSLAEVLAESAEPAPVQQILGKLGFYWGYMSLVLCVFLGVIAYVVM